MKHYDYIIAGAGCAGLSLAMRLISSGKLRDKTILLADREKKENNDRTWCYWETGEGLFEPIVFRSWDHLWFHAPARGARLDISPYRYKMIRGADFYRYCFDTLQRDPRVELIYGNVGNITENRDNATLLIDEEPVSGSYLFSSVLPQLLVQQRGRHYLLQHFTGWHIRTERACFDITAATIMDFRVPQDQGHCFMYVLPFSDHEAMIECTFFSESTCAESVYQAFLKSYINDRLDCGRYQVVAHETGIIPMTNHRFPEPGNRVLHLGTAGGFTKPSSGYTFSFIQEHTARIVSALESTGRPEGTNTIPNRFRWYDTLMLQVLQQRDLPAADLFKPFFLNNKPANALRFLDNKTSLQEDLEMIATLPKKPFLSAVWRELLNRISIQA